MKSKASAGFTLIELMVAVAVLAVLLGVALPGMAGYNERNRLKSVAEGLVSDLALARTEAIMRGPGSTFNLSFTTDGASQWCYGLTTNASCDCTVADPTDANACVVNSSGEDVLRVVDSANFQSDVQMTAVTFTGNKVNFNSTRGMADAGQVSFDAAGKQIDVEVTALGSIRICSSSDLGYSGC